MTTKPQTLKPELFLRFVSIETKASCGYELDMSEFGTFLTEQLDEKIANLAPSCFDCASRSTVMETVTRMEDMQKIVLARGICKGSACDRADTHGVQHSLLNQAKTVNTVAFKPGIVSAKLSKDVPLDSDSAW